MTGAVPSAWAAVRPRPPTPSEVARVTERRRFIPYAIGRTFRTLESDFGRNRWSRRATMPARRLCEAERHVRGYLVVLVVAVATTGIATPIVRVFAERFG